MVPAVESRHPIRISARNFLGADILIDLANLAVDMRKFRQVEIKPEPSFADVEWMTYLVRVYNLRL